MSILVVGSVAYDTVETPFGKADRVLGGSATFFVLAASYFVKPRLVGIVGADFPREFLDEFTRRGVDLSGLQVSREGKTFQIQSMMQTNKKYGMVTMCIGGGMGAAAIFENLQN